MTIDEMIKKLKEVDEMLMCDVDLELTDYARAKAHNDLWDAIQRLKDNEDGDDF